MVTESPRWTVVVAQYGDGSNGPYGGVSEIAWQSEGAMARDRDE